MRKLVYDAPTRVFHTLFAAFFICAFIIGKTVDHHSPIFPYHMLIGMTMSLLVVLRVVWGFAGTRYARFSGFALHPKDLVNYFKGIKAGDKRTWAGHNPASSWAALIMMTLTLGMGTTGYMMVTGGGDIFEEVHEILANTFVVVAILHVSGVALHTFRLRDGIAFSMLEGKKAGVPDGQEISAEKNAIGVLFLGLVAAFAVTLINGFDKEKGSLTLFGTVLQLGENEKEKEEGHGHSHGPGEEHDSMPEDEGEEDDVDFLFEDHGE